MTSKYKKNDIINKYPNRYGQPVIYKGNKFYLTEHPTLQVNTIGDKTLLYYSALAVEENDLIQSVPDKNGYVTLNDYGVFWHIYNCYLNKIGWFYDFEIDGEEVGKKMLTDIEDACDWENPNLVLRF